MWNGQVEGDERFALYKGTGAWRRGTYNFSHSRKQTVHSIIQSSNKYTYMYLSWPGVKVDLLLPTETKRQSEREAKTEYHRRETGLVWGMSEVKDQCDLFRVWKGLPVVMFVDTSYRGVADSDEKHRSIVDAGEDGGRGFEAEASA